MLETQLYLVNGIVALLAAAIPIYLTIRLNNNLKKLTAILSVFILTYAVYSWLGFFGFDFLSDGIFEPLSAAVLMFFGISYYVVAKQRKVNIKKMVIMLSPVALLFVFFGTIILLLAALSIFAWLAARSKDIRSFQFQISAFIIIWVLGGVVYILQDSGFVVVSPLQGDVGLEINVVSLVFLSTLVWLRFYYSQRRRKRIIEA
ncbi:MAG TPA: hypothetical protein VFM18_02045 [Methanosarcina sp.]|nr:hypothetical protein [Methanosarcina sp.]